MLNVGHSLAGDLIGQGEQVITWKLHDSLLKFAFP
ncbi:hypothetical protein WG8_2112 [Paenibacillus sp. Aloe-11]|nr:hypothetical protein WG8_2112 [Paenibacillus sp. Aloe-11]